MCNIQCLPVIVKLLLRFVRHYLWVVSSNRLLMAEASGARERLNSIVSYWKKGSNPEAAPESSKEHGEPAEAKPLSLGKALWNKAREHVSSGTFTELAKKNNMFLKSLWQLPYTAHWWQSVAQGEHRTVSSDATNEKLFLDPSVVAGNFENELKFFILPNSIPESVVCISLVLDVGSLNEGDGEEGYAHFLEHLVFRSTKRFPDGAFYQFLQNIGASIGADANATTSFGNTSFDFKFSYTTAKELRDRTETILTFFVDILTGVVFSDDAISVGKHHFFHFICIFITPAPTH
jgi:hypothetical protein